MKQWVAGACQGPSAFRIWKKWTELLFDNRWMMGFPSASSRAPGNKRPGVGLPKVEAHTVRERNLKPGPGLLNATWGLRS